MTLPIILRFDNTGTLKQGRLAVSRLASTVDLDPADPGSARPGPRRPGRWPAATGTMAAAVAPRRLPAAEAADLHRPVRSHGDGAHAGEGVESSRGVAGDDDPTCLDGVGRDEQVEGSPLGTRGAS